MDLTPAERIARTPIASAIAQVGGLQDAGESVSAGQVADAVLAAIREQGLTLVEADTGELGLPYAEAGSVAQSLTQAAIDRGAVTYEAAIAWLRAADPEDSLWGRLGPIVDQIESSIAFNIRQEA